MRVLRTSSIVALAGVALANPASAQSVADRTPNLTGGWTAARGVIQFNFIHRFEVSAAPLRKVTNFPTFLVATGVTDRSMVGFNYAPNSDLVPAYPNEWEYFGRFAALTQGEGGGLDLSLQAGYNLASESVDAELLLARRAGRLKLLAAGRVFSRGYDGSEERFAVAGGASLRLTNWLALSGDYALLLDRADDEEAAWGAGIQLGVPYTPHSFSLQVTNVNGATLEGTSRGGNTRVGFEYTVPITLSRYFGRRTSPEPDAPDMTDEPAAMRRAANQPAGADTVRIAIANLSFRTAALEIDSGTTVVWTNEDPLAHTVTADDGSFDSGIIEPGNSWIHTFSRPGTYPYHCTPHPFMTARVTVRAPMDVRDRP